MIRRITASFLAVLAAVIALIIVPLGLTLSAQQRRDFVDSAYVAARAAAAITEERIGDRTDGEQASAGALPVDSGDGIVVLDPGGTPLLAAGRHVDPTVIAQVRAHRRAHLPDAVVSTATVGDARHRDGTVILVRDAEPVDHRLFTLWAGLGAAGAVAMVVGALTAAGLAHWISRPLRDLQAVAARMGGGDLAARVNSGSGPPEVRALARTFAGMAERVGLLLQSQRVMTADVSHQLRTPLSALRLRLELLVDDAPDPLQDELLAALRETARLSRLTDGLLAVARAEAFTTHPAPIDVTAVAAERVDAWRPIAEERGVRVSAELDDVPAAWATPGNLEQILDNLVANALDALHPCGRLTLAVRPDDDHVEVRVRDNGPGMPPERLATAFTRYSSDRAEPTKTGLGLPIVARLIAADHGSCRLEPTPGGGLTAILRLPAGPEGSATQSTVRRPRPISRQQPAES